jgi:hypothetical protein
MKQVRLETRTDTARLTGSRNVSAGLWLKVDGQAFPAEGWNDFVVLVLIEWADALLGLLNREDQGFDVRFYEGPYYARLTVVSPGSCQLLLVEDKLPPREVGQFTVGIQPLAEGVVQAARIILETCKDNGWTDRYSEQLAARTREIVSALAGGSPVWWYRFSRLIGLDPIQYFSGTKCWCVIGGRR